MVRYWHQGVLGVFWRANSQGVPLHDGSGGWRPGPSPGISDLMAVGGRTGRFVAVECKRPGEHPKRHQRAWLDLVERSGGLVVVAHSGAELEAALSREASRL
jgi:hypothetical protein